MSTCKGRHALGLAPTLLLTAAAALAQGEQRGESAQPESPLQAQERAQEQSRDDARDSRVAAAGGARRASAVAEVGPVADSDVRGTVRFEERDGALLVTAQIEGLEDGKHGFHVHEGTSCESPGDHYNPGNDPHGSPLQARHHAGDMGNLVAENGVAEYEALLPDLSLSGPRSIVGRAVIVHRGEDQFIPQPDGEAGPEIGCGVIESAPR